MRKHFFKKNNKNRPLHIKYIEEMGFFLLYNYKSKQNRQFPQCSGNIFTSFEQKGVAPWRSEKSIFFGESKPPKIYVHVEVGLGD